MIGDGGIFESDLLGASCELDETLGTMLLGRERVAQVHASSWSGVGGIHFS
jgi:hypothetical protein